MFSFVKRIPCKARTIVAGACAAVVGLFVASQPAQAAIDLTDVVFPLTEIEAVAALILAALAGIWVIRHVLSLPRGR